MSVLATIKHKFSAAKEIDYDDRVLQRRKLQVKHQTLPSLEKISHHKLFKTRSETSSLQNECAVKHFFYFFFSVNIKKMSL
jgi:hypothetical protein